MIEWSRRNCIYLKAVCLLEDKAKFFIKYESITSASPQVETTLNPIYPSALRTTIGFA